MTILQGFMATPSPVYDLSAINSPNIDDQGGATTTYGVRFRFNTDGTYDIVLNQGSDSVPVGTFVLPVGNATQLYVRCTVNTGALTVGTASTWQQITTQRVFGKEHTSGGGTDLVSYDWDIELATDSGGSKIVATANPRGEIGETL